MNQFQHPSRLRSSGRYHRQVIAGPASVTPRLAHHAADHAAVDKRRFREVKHHLRTVRVHLSQRLIKVGDVAEIMLPTQRHNPQIAASAFHSDVSDAGHTDSKNGFDCPVHDRLKSLP